MADPFDQGLNPADQTAADLEEMRRREQGGPPQEGSSVYVGPAGVPRITVGPGSVTAAPPVPADAPTVPPQYSPYAFDQSWAATQPPPQIPPPEEPDPNARGDPTTIALRAFNQAGFGLPNRAVAVKQVLTGESPSYSEALANLNKRQQQVQKQYPWTTGATDAAAVTAATLGTMGMGAASSLARLPANAAIWQRAIPAAAEGGLIGGLQGLGQTYSGIPSDYAKNFGMGSILGAGVGAAAPVVAAGVVGGARGASDFLGSQLGTRTGLQNAAAIDRTGIINLPPGAMLVDAGPSMKGIGQAAVLGEPTPGKAALVDALTQRNMDTSQRVLGGTDTILGPAPIPSRVAAGIQDSIDAMSPAYKAALENAPPVDLRPVANWINQRSMDAAGAPLTALQRVRAMLDVNGLPGTLDTGARKLQAVRAAVRGMRDNQNLDDTTRGLMRETYKRLTQELEDKVPLIRDLNSQRAELGSQKRAVLGEPPPGSGQTSAGADIFAKGQGSVLRPVELQDILDRAAKPKGSNVAMSDEPLRLRQAARAELDRIVGTNANDLNALERVLGQPQDYNAQKLAIMFGPDRAARMMDLLNRERTWRQSFQDIVAGSQTAARQAALESMKQSESKIPVNLTWEGLALRAGQEVWDRFRGSVFGSTRDKIARDLATSDPVRIQQLADQWSAAHGRRDMRAELAQRLVEQAMKSSVPLVARPSPDNYRHR